jgi:hypothetical protein
LRTTTFFFFARSCCVLWQALGVLDFNDTRRCFILFGDGAPNKRLFFIFPGKNINGGAVDELTFKKAELTATQHLRYLSACLVGLSGLVCGLVVSYVVLLMSVSRS